MIFCRSFRLLRLAAAIFLASGAEAQIGGDGPMRQEDDLRAALVLGFARFTEWPVGPEGPVVIGVLGRPAMAVALERMAVGKTVHGRGVVVKLLRQPAQIAGCHIVYIGRLPGPLLTEAMGEALGTVLTIGEEDRFVAAGGAVHLFEEDGRMSFEVNLAALRSINVAISSKLLRLGYTSGAIRRGRGAP